MQYVAKIQGLSSTHYKVHSGTIYMNTRVNLKHVAKTLNTHSTSPSADKSRDASLDASFKSNDF